MSLRKTIKNIVGRVEDEGDSMSDEEEESSGEVGSVRPVVVVSKAGANDSSGGEESESAPDEETLNSSEQDDDDDDSPVSRADFNCLWEIVEKQQQRIQALEEALMKDK